MKSLIAALALATVASPCFALPAAPQAAGGPQAITQGSTDTITTTVQLRRQTPSSINRQNGAMRSNDPDLFVRDYLRTDPPGAHWGNN
jgi:hypothetical protein